MYSRIDELDFHRPSCMIRNSGTPCVKPCVANPARSEWPPNRFRSSSAARPPLHDLGDGAVGQAPWSQLLPVRVMEQKATPSVILEATSQARQARTGQVTG
jgi:hypothetical protein